jgi:GDP-L-fucose synthase
MRQSDKIYIAGHKGMVGSALQRNLQSKGYQNIISRASTELDLRNQAAVEDFFATERPDYVFIAAAKVGGIIANNTYRAEFIYDNLMIEANLINSSYRNGVTKLLYLGSSCIYPKLAPQPLKEEYLLTNTLEETNEPYAIAKIAGIKLCDAYRAQYGSNFISAMPTNMYGPNDNYDLKNSHVLPALMRKMIIAKNTKASFVEVWGTGSPKREFMHVDDLAEACYFLMMNVNEPGFVNVGTGEDISILDLTKLVKDIVGFEGEIRTNPSMPDGTPRKLMDVSKINAMGWKATISLRDGIEAVYNDIKNRDWD